MSLIATNKMKNLMPKLKRIAEQLNCKVDDNRGGTAIEVQTKNGWSWENGERCSMHRAYGSGGSYLPEWRQDCIADVIDELTQDPPEPVPFAYE